MVYSTINLQLIIIACLAGFIGDYILQILITFMGGKTGWGLREYFKQHGSVESLFIAGGMMTLFYIIYLILLGLPPLWYYLAIYGILLDLFFRETMIFPSLQGYYDHLNYFWSAFWGAVPMILPLGIMKLSSFSF
jgi:putative flippase GtrA